MASPVIEALVNARVQDLIEPPRSWGKLEKIAFLRLPLDLQAFYAERERNRDREVRRCQNDRAVALRKLASAEAQLEEAKSRLAALTKQTEDHRDQAKEPEPR